jgi:hypothetical protein
MKPSSFGIFKKKTKIKQKARMWNIDVKNVTHIPEKH